MAITIEEIEDQIEITETGHVQVRCRKIVKDDGVVIASNVLSRKVISPGDDYSAESAKVQAICTAVHTQEVIDAYLASLPQPEEEVEEAEEEEKPADKAEEPVE
jgi:predicted O-methyltransferase YrrM